MAAGVEMNSESAVTTAAGDVDSPKNETGNNCTSDTNVISVSNGDAKISDSKSEFKMQDNLVDMFSNLNPMAKEFFPSSYSNDRCRDQFAAVPFKNSGNGGHPNDRRV